MLIRAVSPEPMLSAYTITVLFPWAAHSVLDESKCCLFPLQDSNIVLELYARDTGSFSYIFWHVYFLNFKSDIARYKTVERKLLVSILCSFWTLISIQSQLARKCVYCIYLYSSSIFSCIYENKKKKSIEIISRHFLFSTKTTAMFSFFHEHARCGYSLEAPQWGASNEYPRHVFCGCTG